MIEDKIIMVGAGNVAHHLSAALLHKGANLCQIYSRTIESARILGMKTGITYTSDIGEIYPDGDIYIFCLKDDALSSLLKNMRFKNDPLLIHTSGTLSMRVLKPYSTSYGVLYPLQTFSKNRELDFGEVPLFIEGSTPQTLKRVRNLAEKLSNHILLAGSERRKTIHLAAVFACNFPNFLYTIAGKLLERDDLDFELLRPLIFESANKVMSLNPSEVQTGPAVRGDEMIMNRHKSCLKHDADWLKLYTLFSDMIIKEYSKEEQQKEDSEATQKDLDMPTLW